MDIEKNVLIVFDISLMLNKFSVICVVDI